MRYIHAILASALALGAACSGGYGSSPTAPGGTTGTTAAPPATTNAIKIVDNAFSPVSTTVAAGTTVTWTWTGANIHNVTFDDGPKSATQNSGTYQRTFNTVGTYSYHCTIHGTAMSGVVTVQ
jgi:plastocyanin